MLHAGLSHSLCVATVVLMLMLTTVGTGGQNMASLTGLSGRTVVHNTRVYAATSRGLEIFNTSLGRVATVLMGEQVLAISAVDDQQFFVCYRGSQSRCEVRQLSNPTVATASINMSGIFVPSLDYATLSRSSVLPRIADNTFYAGFPTAAVNGNQARTAIRFTRSAATLNIIASLIIDPDASVPRFGDFVNSFTVNGGAYFVYNLPNVQVGSRRVDVGFIGHVCLTDVGSSVPSEYPKMYGGWAQVSLPSWDSSSNLGLVGNTIVDAHLDSASIYIAFRSTPQVPGFISTIPVANLRLLFANTLHSCNFKLEGARIAEYINITAKCGDREAFRGGLSTPTCFGTSSDIQALTSYPVSLINSKHTTLLLSLDLLPASLRFRYDIRSIANSDINKLPVFFVGTSTGEIMKLFEPSTGIWWVFEVVKLDDRSQPVTDITISGGNYYATLQGGSTASEVRSGPVDDCHLHTSCGSCVNPGRYQAAVSTGRHPFCFWCAYRGECKNDGGPAVNSARCDLPGFSNLYIMDDMFCPNITAITPPLTSALVSDQITLSADNFPAVSGTFECRYPDVPSLASAASVPATSSTTATGSTTFTCASPRGGTNGQGFADVNVAIYSSTLQRVLLSTDETKLSLYNCQFITRCEQCTDAQIGCGWCSYANECRPTGGCSDQVMSCPVISAVDPLAISIAVATNLTFTSTAFPAPRTGDTYECSISSRDGQLSQNTTATLTGNKLYCKQFTLNSSFVPVVGNGSEELRIAPVFNGYVMTNNSEFIKSESYDCSRTGANGCSPCLAFPQYDRCRWCPSREVCMVDSCTGEPASMMCPSPNITNIKPRTGPTAGGTAILIEGVNFGFQQSDIVDITFNQMSCTNIRDFSIISGVRCDTPNLGGTTSQNFPVTISTNVGGLLSSGTGGNFTFRPTLVSSVTPAMGPVSGGTEITITGQYLKFPAGKTTVLVTQSPCYILSVNENVITCRTTNGTMGMNNFVLTIDGYSFTQQFQYVPDPTVTEPSRTNTIAVGGIPLIFSGSNLEGVGSRQAQFTFLENNATISLNITCTVPQANQLSCIIPPIPIDGVASVTLFLDGLVFATSVALTATTSPLFEQEDHIIISGVEQTITLNGTDITIGDLMASEYSVVIGDDGVCDKITIEANRLVCQPPTSQPNGQAINGSLPIVVRAGNFVAAAGGATYQPLSDTSINAALIAGPIGAVVAVLLIVLLVVFLRFRRRETAHTSQMKSLLYQMDAIEANVASECKSAFADLQTNLDDLGITQETSFEALPFWSFDEYANKLLFPHSRLVPLEQRVNLPDGELANLRDSMKRFEQRLLLDKKFLIPFIETLESQKKFVMVDRVFVASLMMVAFQDNLFYATEILKVLLTSLIRNGSGKNPKLLLRRTESVAEKLLTNWLSFCLHDYIRAEVGTPLFMLFHAMKTHIEKGPVDAVTGEARNCLSEERLLRDKVDCVELACYAVESLHHQRQQNQRHTVHLLSCDSISQAKSKVMDAIYKTMAISRRPAFDLMDLSLVSPTGTSTIPMQDLDQTSAVHGDQQQINTLGFYQVKQGSTFCVTRRGEATLGRARDQLSVLFPRHSQMQRMASEDAGKIWHLTKPQESNDNQAANGGRAAVGAKLVSEIYLTRLLSAKKTLQTYVDGLFRVVFCSDDGRVPAAIKYLFDFIDHQAIDMGISDPDAIQTWKNNSIPLRFWINVIKNPEFVLDINKTATVDNCLSVVAQAFMDSCSTQDMRLTKDSPSTKLLYAKEVKENYRQKIQSYYSEIAAMRPIEESEMQEMMRKASETHMRHSDLLPKDSAVFELFLYASRYADEISDTLEEDNRTGLVKVFESLLSDVPESVQKAQMQQSSVAGQNGGQTVTQVV
ncbi:plexin-B1-like [Sycon ciliatum]|uniref:plexin-B1-like n=1 Tax=Sycon ciliatum TaxID=27933 RepID=UPI0031F67799